LFVILFDGFIIISCFSSRSAWYGNKAEQK
jgi:hypothetical protein